MKFIIIHILFLLLTLNIFSQGNSTEILYKDLGEWSIDVDNNKISISCFVTIENIQLKMHSYKIKSKKKVSYNIDNIGKRSIYRYRIYLENKSIYNGDTVNIWIYGTKIFINNNEISNEKFPNGFLIPIKTKPTLIYWYDTKEFEKLKFQIKWDKITFE